jgi:hypothetical protein
MIKLILLLMKNINAFNLLETSLLKYQLSDGHSWIIFLVIIIYFKIESTKIYI